MDLRKFFLAFMQKMEFIPFLEIMITVFTVSIMETIRLQNNLLRLSIMKKG